MTTVQTTFCIPVQWTCLLFTDNNEQPRNFNLIIFSSDLFLLSSYNFMLLLKDVCEWFLIQEPTHWSHNISYNYSIVLEHCNPFPPHKYEHWDRNGDKSCYLCCLISHNQLSYRQLWGCHYYVGMSMPIPYTDTFNPLESIYFALSLVNVGRTGMRNNKNTRIDKSKQIKWVWKFAIFASELNVVLKKFWSKTSRKAIKKHKAILLS